MAGLGASFVPYATRDFTPRLTFGQSWFRYDDFAELDFDSQTLTLDVKYDLNSKRYVVRERFLRGCRASVRHMDAMGEFYRYGFLNGSVTHFRQLGTRRFI